MFNLAYKYLPERVIQGLTAVYFKGAAYYIHGHRAHSEITEGRNKDMSVTTIPALVDNYMFLIVDENTKEAAVVDPVEPDKILELVEQLQVKLTKVLTTHHHWDHAGGNQDLVKKSKIPLEVYGGDDRIPGLTNKVKDGDCFKIGESSVECLFTPCHTRGHICYFVNSPLNSPAVFTGDTLFVAGCGRFFEGTSEEMCQSLDKLAYLPDDTRVYCGHEYTLVNLLFARQVEPDNEYIANKIKSASQTRKFKKPTIPSTIGEEKNINPFMRLLEKSVQQHVGCSDLVEVMERLRKQKNDYKH